ncbi:MAG: hypothetical protein IJM81_04870 [Prevotella sp.]|nr:hypothetical protein [Prevotella sp.]
MKVKLFSTLLLAALLLTGCGQGHEAKSLIKSFIGEYMSGDRKSVTYSRLDSTRFVTADDIAAMRNRLPKARYVNVKPPVNLLFMSTSYIDAQGNNHRQTFYIDEQMQGIVCFKEN